MHQSLTSEKFKTDTEHIKQLNNNPSSMDRSKQINNKRPIISCSMFQPTPSELPPSNHDKSSSQIIDARFVEAIFLIGFLPGVTKENVCFYDSGASINVVAETSVVNFHNKFLNPDTESQCLYGLSGKKKSWG